MPVILLKRDGLHDIVRHDLVSSRLNRELNGLTTISRRQNQGFDGGADSGDGYYHHHHHYQFTSFTGEPSSSTDGGAASQVATPTSTPGNLPVSPSPSSNSGIYDPTSSPSDGVFSSPSPSLSDSSIISFPSSTESSTATSIPSSQNATVIGPNLAGGVVGGIIGLVAIVIACILLFKARQRKRMAPSSEFLTVTAIPVSFSQSPMRLDNSSDMPPPFTQGSYNAPLHEKFDAIGESKLSR